MYAFVLRFARTFITTLYVIVLSFLQPQHKPTLTNTNAPLLPARERPIQRPASPDGEELDDLGAAKGEAAAAARALMSEGLRAGAPLGLHREMIIEDEHGVPVASVSFAEALPAED